MGRSPHDVKHVNLTIYLHPDDAAYALELKKELGWSSNADLFREIVRSLKGCFGLPKSMADVLEADRKEKGLNILEYVREMAAHYYEHLKEGGAEQKPGGARSKRSHA